MSHDTKQPVDFLSRAQVTETEQNDATQREVPTRPLQPGEYGSMVDSLTRTLVKRNADARKGPAAQKARSRKALSRVLGQIMDQDS